MATFYEAYAAKQRMSRTLHTASSSTIYGIGVGLADPNNPKKGAAVIVYAPTTGVSKVENHMDLNVKGTKVRVPIRVIQSGSFHANASTRVAPYTGRIRPVPAGYSVGSPEGSGTAGLIVINYPARTQLYVLSNNHVLNKNNSTGYTETIQPGGADGGRTRIDRIGRLDRFIRLSKTGVNYLDAATSIPLRNSLLNPRYATVGVLPGHVTGYPVGTVFKKVGRTTGLVTGKVQSIHTDIRVNYGDYGGLGEIRFRNQTIVTSSKPISLPGDSGSVWLRNDNNYAAAVNYAGNSAGTLSVAYPVQWFMQAFGTRVAAPASGAGKVLRVSRSAGFTRPLTAGELSRIKVIRARRK